MRIYSQLMVQFIMHFKTHVIHDYKEFVDVINEASL